MGPGVYGVFLSISRKGKCAQWSKVPGPRGLLELRALKVEGRMGPKGSKGPMGPRSSGPKGLQVHMGSRSQCGQVI